MTVWVISIPGCAVDALADQVRVAVMARVLLDHVGIHPAQAHLRLTTGMEERLVQRMASCCRAGKLKLGGERSKVGLGSGGSRAVESGVGVFVVQYR